MPGQVRTSPIAGSWYPGESSELKSDIQAYLKEASIPHISEKPVALISPHAGYMYSGKVAAYAYKTILDREYSTVVVISPSHRAYFPYISVWGDGAYSTPLGQVIVDEGLSAEILKESLIIKEDKRPHITEHALEIQLPFLQVALKKFSLCPLIMGQQDFDLCTRLSQALFDCIGQRDDVLVVASSDLSHFHSYAKASAMDQLIAKRIETFDIDGLSRDLEEGKSEACGGGAILTAMLYAQQREKKNSLILKYANSGDVTGDKSSVVGYLAAVI
jgi:AmmeMemoRadiSam system protein B